MFDPKNEIVQLCAKGIELEATNLSEAKKLYEQAWQLSETPIDKLTAAHYMARIQPDVLHKLKWDKIALEQALLIDSAEVKGSLPSLYLNIGKCHEDMGQRKEALEHYVKAQEYVKYLNKDGYGTMINKGIAAGIERCGKAG